MNGKNPLEGKLFNIGSPIAKRYIENYDGYGNEEQPHDVLNSDAGITRQTYRG